MPTKQAQDRFDDLLASTAAQRTAVRANAASGRWQDSEPVEQRAAAYAAKVGMPLRNGAESQIGQSLDYQSTAFLALGAIIRRTVGLVEVNLGNESRTGTGFLIGNGLFITNQHVIQSADDARSTTVTFDHELDISRTPLATSTFRLDPDRLFLSSPEDTLDFAVVALGARVSGSASPETLGACPLNPEPNKHVVGMNVNIVQHPKGNYKQIAIRNNLLTYRTERSLLYETDTEVGSSGSPVFNDSWDVVALHHYGQPHLAAVDAANAPDIPVNANEGIRISVVHQALTDALGRLAPEQQAQLAPALALYKSDPDTGLSGSAGRVRGVLGPRRVTNDTAAATAPPPLRQSFSTAAPDTAGSGPPPTIFSIAPLAKTPNTGESAMTSNASSPAITVQVPLEITLRLGLPQTADTGAAPRAVDDVGSPAARLTRGAEAARVDRDYSSRTGYQEDFLPAHRIPLPQPEGALARQVAPLRADEPDAKEGLLKYEHFSLKMHKTRRVAIFTATNIDGDTYKKIDRTTGLASAEEGDTWFKDTRISESFWLGQDFYASTSSYFDRGHLTRRTDPTWGSAEEAQRANADTFHFTNCSPQHFRFNETTPYWQGVERYVLETGVIQAGPASRLCVFQGPLYDDSIDLWIDDEVQIPSSFWKIVVWRGAQGLKCVGLVVDQLQLLSEVRGRALARPTEVAHVDVSMWRVHVQDIGRRTSLSFDPALVAADTIGQPVQPQPGAEAAKGLRVRSFQDIVL